MITLTKEWLMKTIAELEEERDATPGVVNEDAAKALAAMKIALASLEAEPVISHLGSKNALDAIVAFIKSNRNPTLKDYNEVSERLFQDNCHGLSNHVIEYIKQIGEELEELRSTQDTAPPAQEAPEVYNIGDATMRHIFTPAVITDVSDMQAVFDQIETVLAGMWQPASVSDSLLSELLAIAKNAAEAADECANSEWGDESMEHSTAIADWERRAAMLQGVEPVTTAYKLPFEQWLSQQTGTIDVECGCVMTEVFFHWLRVAYEAGNSPVTPDGWVLVPEEPTHEMLEAGDEQFGTYDVYRRMIAASPQQK
ncbi:hypothetical protein [Enterobacter hormaechei]|uniref:hypothetical protein n=1 Tax=Enterobacter hormaechei TaxID=158836 RepID=UPI00084BD285|nr:hypothetical protein BFV68_13490 [Enterobacter hormaechei subsp. steigerwaltii]